MTPRTAPTTPAEARTATAKKAAPPRKKPISPKAVVYGTQIRKAREAKRMPEQELADELGVSQNAVNKIENGRVHLTVERLEQIAEILGVKASDLVPSLTKVDTINQTNQHNSTVNGNAVYQVDFEYERKVWQELDKSRQGELMAKNETIVAQNALIAAKEETIQALRSSSSKGK